MRDATARRLSAIHAAAYRLTRGRIGRRLVRNDMLLLTTRGRRTGRPHTVPLLYLRDGRDLVVIASWGGRDRHPEWYLNLAADPSVWVQIDGTQGGATATSMRDDERSAWWSRAVDAYAGYTGYRAKTTRSIPVVRIVTEEEMR
ncbi:MAG: nitroreductase family deazaflavin-dependent oxidoreductase [Acidimicrobiia bacterium]